MRKRISIAVMMVAAALLVFSVTRHGGATTELASTAMGQGLRTQAVSLEESVSAAGGAASSSILQFKAGGHLLGFQPNRAYVVGMDHALSVEFLGTPGVMPQAAGEVEQKTDRSAAPALGKVVYPGLWEGINLIYTPDKDGIAETTYEVAPGADVSKIRLAYNVPVQLQPDGSLRFQFDRGYMTESAPIAWQDVGGKRVLVEVAFRLSGEELGFIVGTYDRNHPLIIDPTYSWHTFYGSGGVDGGYALAVDASGNVYITGYSDASWSGPAGEAPLHTYSGNADVFVLKLNSNGVYQWHTFYGSAGFDYGSFGLAVDSGGNVCIAGYSNASWNGPADEAPLHAYNGNMDLFLLKLNGNGAYQWHTFYGSATTDWSYALTVDTSGNVYVTGYSYSNWSGPALEAPLHAHSGGAEVYVLKLNSNGAYQWHTFYGSITTDYGYGLALDAGGNVYVTGYGYASWSGAAGQAPLHAYSGSNDIFVLKLNSSGAYQWHAFYGSTDADGGIGLAVDSGGNVYATGYSSATWSGPALQEPLHIHSGGADVFVLKLNSSGGYQWHTFHGSTDTDRGYGLVTDAGGNVYVTGYSSATWSGPALQEPLDAHSGGDDVFVLKLNSSGSYQWHTFHGSTDTDRGYGPAVDSTGNVFVTGYSFASWSGPASHTPLNGHSGSNDIFVLKLNGSGAYQWHTFYGSRGADSGQSLAVDASGNVYITGSSLGTWRGPTGQEPLHAHSGGEDVFVLKLSSSGSYQWHTFYGSEGRDAGTGLAVDASGNVYISGYTEAAWLGPALQEPLHIHSGGTDVFVLKLNSNGTYQWHTFYGSASTDSCLAFALDSSCNVYVAGHSYATWDGPSAQAPLHGYSDRFDIFVLKLSSNGLYQWHTFYGSTGSDVPRSLRVDAGGNVYVTGESSSWAGPALQEPLHGYSGGNDIFVLKLNGDGAYQWHTFFGSNYFDNAHGLALDAGGNVYVTGQSSASWSGAAGQAPLHAYSGSNDIFVLKLNGDGAYRWHTFYGSEDSDGGYRLDVGAGGNVYVTGISRSTWTGPALQEPLHAHSGSGDAFVLKLNSTGAYQWHAFYGSTADDFGSGLALGAGGNLYLLGASAATWNGPVGEAPLHAYSGGYDLWVLKMTNEVPGDLIDDGMPDIIWRNSATGANVVWFMDGANFLSAAQLPAVTDLNWKIVGMADFDHDGHSDILWSHKFGANVVWHMNGSNLQYASYLLTVSDLNWEAVGVADFNNDGNPDILWRNHATGATAVWYMNGTNFQGAEQLPTVTDTNWDIVGIADFDLDGHLDILWRNAFTGTSAVWYLNGANFRYASQLLTVSDTNWQMAGTADFDGDSHPDIIWRNTATGATAVWYMDGANFRYAAQLPTVTDTNWEIVGP